MKEVKIGDVVKIKGWDYGFNHPCKISHIFDYSKSIGTRLIEVILPDNSVSIFSSEEVEKIYKETEYPEYYI